MGTKNNAYGEFLFCRDVFAFQTDLQRRLDYVLHSLKNPSNLLFEKFYIVYKNLLLILDFKLNPATQ